uniref:RxLR effector candidate protein n=1 Tax=Hyaloperonospora arabidopsidis (strain Emoy2) TaxID=559515 RepID=M4BEA1_HYAAE|nr:RxLR effector candidate protein [Hyaloperonospora arabidopsidis Emoy2]
MEAVTEHLQRLLEACVAVSTAAAAISTDTCDIDTRVRTVDASLGLPSEHLQYWDLLCDESLPLVKDLALLLASTNISTNKMLSLLRVILVHPSLHCAGLVRLAQMVFHGFKLTKRWDVLNAVSSHLLDAIYAKILQKDTRERAFRFYVDVLGGFQHSAELFTTNVTKLIQLANLFSTEDNDQNREMGNLLLVLCAALEHCHRGYEAEAMTLRRAMQLNVGPRVIQPTAAEAERLLRASAWVLPAEKLDAMLPSIEGKWVADEFVSDQQCNGGPHHNAGSVLLKKTTNCFAHKVRATIIDPKLKHKLELTGSLFQQMPEMQVLLSYSGTRAASTWKLEGHWRQLDEDIASVTLAPPTTLVSAPNWHCGACTMNNEGSLTLCSTCGTERPADAVTQAAPSSDKGNNPAPYSAVLSSDMSFMRIKWSRGEQQGVWLARKQIIETNFDLTTSLVAGNDAMMDSTRLPAFVFSPEGIPARILVLERPLLSTSDHTEFTVQVWIRPQQAPSEIEAQVVFANGQDFELILTSAGHLVWHVAGGRYTVTSRDAVQFGVFCHVTLLFGHDTMILLLDGSTAGESTRSDEENHIVLGASLLSIGGSIENCDSQKNGKVRSCFYGQLLDLRIYSTLLSNLDRAYSIRNALSGREGHLVGYFPLVGDSERLLMDLSNQQNHACVLDGYQSPDSVHDAAIPSVCNSAPAIPIEAIPVENALALSLGADFIGCGELSFSDGCQGLHIGCRDSGATLWRQNAVFIACGFQSFFSIAPPVSPETPSSRRSVVFALCEATFWNLVPLLSEAAGISHAACDDEKAPLCPFNGSAMLINISSDVVAPGILMYDLGLYIWSRKRGNPLSRVYRVAGSPSTAPSDVHLKYELPERILSVAIGGVGVVFEVALDLELALCMEPGSPARVGLIFPASKNSTSQRSSTRLTNWSFESFNTSLPNDAANSVLGNVYSSFRLEGSDGDMGHGDGANGTTLCTRVSTDGSAIAQQSYGCQTCNLVHGNSVCRVCAVICHESHELVALGVTTTACACRIRGSGLCRCNSAVQASDFPMLTEPVNASLWGCSKCTVINSIDLEQCSVCGNNAPELDASSASAAPKSILSASAPVEQSTPAVNWSCNACTMLNEANDTKCSVCDTLRAKQADPVLGEASEMSKTNKGLTALYYAVDDAAKQDHRMAMQPTSSWICSACTMKNKTLDATCHMCATARKIPVSSIVGSPEVVMTPPTLKIDDLPASVSTGMDMDMDGGDPVIVSESVVTRQPSKTENVKLLDEYKRTAAIVLNHLLEVGSMNDSVWETTGGTMRVALGDSFVGEYICGTYMARDGKLSGLARVTEEGTWKFDGKFKKVSQSQSNACMLSWDKTASRFDGKWYRGDGSGDWKCLSAPYTSDFRGIALADPVKKPSEFQPYYTGMVNMKQNLTNVCYQNSFLQTLYMTQDFRRFIMSCDATNYAEPYKDNGVTTGGNVVATIQHLFAQMTASQRPFLASHAIQQCLPAEFKNGRQQDTSDFAHFLIDSLSQRLSQHQVITDEIPSIFGGHQATILACKTCGKKSVNREYFWELLLNMIDLRYTPITSISAVSGSAMDIQTPGGYERLNADLNKDRTGAPYVYLCVRRCPERVISDSSMEDESDQVMPITELVVKVISSTDPKPSLPGFERVELDLNVGGGTTSGLKKQVYLLFRREPNGSPITDLQVIYGNESIPDGFKQIHVDLNQSEGSKVYLCYRCDMPITDLKIVNSGITGYRMVDHLLNVSHGDAVKQYLALKVGGNEPCLTDLKLVEGSDVFAYEEQGWQSIGSPFSSAALLDPSMDEKPFVPSQLIVRRGHGNPIFAIDVFRAPRQVPKYNDYEIIELFSADTTCTDAFARLKGDWLGTEETERERRAVRIRSVSESIPGALLVKGCMDGKGELYCVTLSVSTWAGTVAPGLAPDAGSGVPVDLPSGETWGSNANPVIYRASGYWKNLNVPSPQLVDVELRPAASNVSGALITPSDMSVADPPEQSYLMSGVIGDGRGSLVAIQGVQTSRKVNTKWPISEIMVLRGDESVPEGVQVVHNTCSGRSGNLLAQTTSLYTLYLAFKREEGPANGHVTDVCVIYGEIDAVPEHYTCIHTTPAGHSANVNDGTLGVPIFICFKRGGDTAAINDESVISKILMDVALVWTSGVQPDAVPTGFTKIQHTPLGMEANLNQGTCGVAIHICLSKSETKEIVKPLDNPLNGEYEITSSPLPAFGRFLTLSVIEELEDARLMEGNFGAVLHGQFIGSMSGILFSSKHQQAGNTKTDTVVGAWRIESSLASGVGASTNDLLPLSYPFELTLNDTCTELDGWWSGVEGVSPTVPKSIVSSSAASSNALVSGLPPAITGGKWKLIKDSYVHVAFKKDYSTEWQDGQLMFSERVWCHDIESMLTRFVATRTLGGDNALSCSVCQRKTEWRTNTVIFEPPEHLIITLKRMYYDWSQQKACKCLHDVQFPALLTLPSLTPEEELAVYTSDAEDSIGAEQQHLSRHYGLYGVLVHSGLTASSGHYYSFCRESDDSTCQLHLEDSPLSPWIKFNDTKVERSDWKEINRLVASTVSDTVYLLLYKKLSYEPTHRNSDGSQDTGAVGGANADDKEAMLLAKAMALSMSAARYDQYRCAEEEESKGDPGAVSDPNGEDGSAQSTGMVTKTLLKKVEEENAAYLQDLVEGSSSALHADDLHTLLVLRHSLPVRLRALLDGVR